MSNQPHPQILSHAPPASDHMIVAFPVDEESAAYGGVAVPFRMVTNPAAKPSSSPSSSPSSASSSSSSGVLLPSSYRTGYLLVSYLLALLVTIEMAVIAKDYKVFLAPAVVVITVLIGLCGWIGQLNMGDFGVDASGQPTMTKTQLIPLVIARFTMGFWVLGVILSLLLGLECTIIAFIPIPDQSTAWFFIVFMCYILNAWQFWFAVYLFTVYRSGAGVTAAEVKLTCVSTQAVALGCTTFQLWSGFLAFAFNVDLFGDITGVDIPAQVNILIMLIATLLAVTLLPADAVGAEHLVLQVRMRAYLRSRLAAHGAEDPKLSRSRDGAVVSWPTLLRGSLLMAKFISLFAILIATSSYLVAVIIYLFCACCMIIPFSIHTTRFHASLNQFIELSIYAQSLQINSQTKSCAV